MGDATEGGTWESLPIEIRAMILKSIGPRERLREINANTLVQLRGHNSCGSCPRCCCSWRRYVKRVCYLSSQDWSMRVALSWSGARALNRCMMWETIAMYADILMGDFPSSLVGWRRSREGGGLLSDALDEDGEEELQARYDTLMRPRLPCLLEYVDIVCTIPVWCDAMTIFRQRYESQFGRLFGVAWRNVGRSELWNVHHYTAAPAMHA